MGREMKWSKTSMFLAAFAIGNLLLWVVIPTLFSAENQEVQSLTQTLEPNSSPLEHATAVPAAALGSGAEAETTTPTPRRRRPGGFTFAPNASVEMGKSFGMALKEGGRDFSKHFGMWPLTCDQCQEDCLGTATKGPAGFAEAKDENPELAAKEGDGDANRAKITEDKKNEFAARHEEIDKLAWNTPISHWGPMALQNLVDENMELWKNTGITLNHHVEMTSCSYRTRMHYNPSGIWVHISGHNITRLRVMVDGYDRYQRQFALLKKVILSHPPLKINTVAYFSVTDTPCNPNLPYLTSFAKRGVKGILVPDDTFETKPGWNQTYHKLDKLAHEFPFSERKRQVLFRASPTHVYRTQFMDNAKSCCPGFANVTLGVMENRNFKHLILPLEQHVHFKYLGAVRGRAASNRDKYLNLLGGAIVRVEETEPWFQFYHALWKPWLNYIPMDPKQMNCTFNALKEGKYDDVAEKIAQRSQEIGAFLTDEVVQGYLWQVLVRYSELQRYTVGNDPLDFLKGIGSFAKKNYKTAQLMPDDRHPVKFVYSAWIRRRIRQIIQCRIEEAVGQTYDPYGKVLINGVPGNRTIPLPAVPGNRCWYM